MGLLLLGLWLLAPRDELLLLLLLKLLLMTNLQSLKHSMASGAGAAARWRIVSNGAAER